MAGLPQIRIVEKLGRTVGFHLCSLSIIRLRLGKQLVNVLHVVKRTNTPLIPQQVSSTAGRIKYFPRYPPEMKSLLDIDRSARISARPVIPPFQGGGVL